MTPVGLQHYLVVSVLLFCLGLLGVVVRRNVLVIYMSLELMLNAANLALAAFSRFNNNLDGQIIVFFIITVAASEVAVGLALIVALYRRRHTTHIEDLPALKDLPMNEPIPWLILFLPLLAAVLITFFLQRDPHFSAIISVGAVLISFFATVVLLAL